MVEQCEWIAFTEYLAKLGGRFVLDFNCFDRIDCALSCFDLALGLSCFNRVCISGLGSLPLLFVDFASVIFVVIESSGTLSRLASSTLSFVCSAMLCLVLRTIEIDCES